MSVDENRMRGLMEKAAAAMEDGRSPFEDAFLSENGVTLDEVYTLSSTISVVLRGYLDSTTVIQREILLRGSVAGPDAPPGLSDTMALFLRGENAIEAMKNYRSRNA